MVWLGSGRKGRAGVMDNVLELDEIVVPVTVEYLEEDGVFKVSCPLQPGCHAWGKTLDDAMRAVPENVRAMIESRRANGTAIPAPLRHCRALTRLVIRMGPA